MRKCRANGKAPILRGWVKRTHHSNMRVEHCFSGKGLLTSDAELRRWLLRRRIWRRNGDRRKIRFTVKLIQMSLQARFVHKRLATKLAENSGFKLGSDRWCRIRIFHAGRLVRLQTPQIWDRTFTKLTEKKWKGMFKDDGSLKIKKSGNWGLDEIDCHCSHKGQCTS